MEEADALADKIAIMALGNMRAVGNSFHLKHRYGAGYHIEVIASKGENDNVKAKIAKMLPDSVLNVESSGNLSYTLPTTRLDMLQKFFLFLEAESDVSSQGLITNKNPGIIQDWGISQTSLEEVFLRLTHGDSHTFAASIVDDNKEKQQSLNVAEEHTPDKYKCFVQIDSLSTLTTVRELLNDNENSTLDGGAYVFVLNGAPVSFGQEPNIYASDFLPTILIRLKSSKPLASSKSTSLFVEASESDSNSNVPPAVLKKKLRTAESKISQLMKENNDLKSRIKELEKKNGDANVVVPTSKESSSIILEESSSSEESDKKNVSLKPVINEGSSSSSSSSH
jgi:hypothetical protein